MKLSVLGCGRWGAFIAWYLDRLGHEVALYGREQSWRMAQLRSTRKNDLLELPERVELTSDLTHAVQRAQWVVISVGVQSFRGLAQELGPVPCAIWVGPGHVQDFTRGIPNCMVIDSADEALKRALVDAFSSELIRFYYGSDLIGNEIGAAAKNVIGIAAGMLDGYHLTSLKGALMARGTREIGRLIQALGGQEHTAFGLSHLGDYEATVFSPHSHNRAFGEAFARREPYTQLAEGAATTRALCRLAEQCGVELPICRAVEDILYNGCDPKQAMDALFARDLKREF